MISPCLFINCILVYKLVHDSVYLFIILFIYYTRLSTACELINLHVALAETVVEQLHVALLLLQLLLQLNNTGLQPPLFFQQRRPDIDEFI